MFNPRSHRSTVGVLGSTVRALFNGLYVKRRYVPDGNGIVKDAKPLSYGEHTVIDHSLVFYLIKEL